jgi:hypothetical protein
MANPTTNYGFVLPTPTDLVTDLPADFEVALQGVDTRLKALQPGTTLGDLAYSSATANTNTRLAVGSTGQVLTVAGGVPTWATPAAGGGGKVLQVVQASSSTSTTIASTTYTDTSLSATITPTSATSKILVQVVQIVSSQRSTADSAGVGIQILRGATTIFTPSPGKFEQMYLSIPGSSANPTALYASVPMIYLDSPSSTSALTYKTQGAIALTASSGTSTYQPGTAISTITLLEIGA